MDYTNQALMGVAHLAAAYDKSKAVVGRLQRQAETLAKEATDAGYDAAKYRQQGRKTRSKLRAQKDEIKKLKAQVKRLEDATYASGVRAASLYRRNCQLVGDLTRAYPAPNIASYYDLEATLEVNRQVIRLQSHCSDVQISMYAIQNLRSDAGFEAVAAHMARQVGEKLAPLYAQAIKQAVTGRP